MALLPHRHDPDAPYDLDPHHHPGLHVIALVEAAKGLLALIAASGLVIAGPVPLLDLLHDLTRRFQLDPQHGVAGWLEHALSPTGVHVAAAIATLYGVLHVAEGWGLWRAKAWASWLGCVTAATYLPFDIYALVMHPRHWMSYAVVAINLVVVWVLARDLFERHIHPPKGQRPG